jgi:hypothetical protein
MALRTCKVTWVDAEGIEHTVHVTAQTLYEAVAQALRVFREHDWCDRDLRGSAASVVVKIAGKRWLNGVLARSRGAR